MALERWQKYYKATPCPVCGGFSSGKKTSGNRCKGFLHQDGEHVYCQNIESGVASNFNGLVLYKHTLETGPGGKRTVRQVPNAQEHIQAALGITYIVEEEKRYEGLMLFGQPQIPETKKWYVVYRDGVEITRDLNKEHLRMFINPEGSSSQLGLCD